MNFDTIVINFVGYKPFLFKKNKNAATITISTYKKVLRCVELPYADLINLFAPLGIKKDLLYFPNICDTDLVYLKIDSIKVDEMVSIIQNKIPSIINQKHYITFSYGCLLQGSYTRLLISQHYRHGIYKHNEIGGCFLKYIQCDDSVECDVVMLGNKYKLQETHDAIVYMETCNRPITLSYIITEGGEMVFNYIPDKQKYNNMLRQRKISNILE